MKLNSRERELASERIENLPPYLVRVVEYLHHLGHGRRFYHLEYHFFMQGYFGHRKN
jgi:hypothetical protein